MLPASQSDLPWVLFPSAKLLYVRPSHEAHKLSLTRLGADELASDLTINRTSRLEDGTSAKLRSTSIAKSMACHSDSGGPSGSQGAECSSRVPCGSCVDSNALWPLRTAKSWSVPEKEDAHVGTAAAPEEVMSTTSPQLVFKRETWCMSRVHTTELSLWRLCSEPSAFKGIASAFINVLYTLASVGPSSGKMPASGRPARSTRATNSGAGNSNELSAFTSAKYTYCRN
mmetsp:Transcript_111436/g.354708  ORF Transcript_111436/g.354708 Transcript_111436/m.354708 type:complete len:228 (+) Transcript_111436:138-821(+)